MTSLELMCSPQVNESPAQKKRSIQSLLYYRWPSLNGHLETDTSLGRILIALSILSELTGQTIPVAMIISKLSSQISQILNSMLEGDRFLAKTLGKSLFDFQTDWSGNGPAGQFWQRESAPCVGPKSVHLKEK